MNFNPTTTEGAAIMQLHARIADIVHSDGSWPGGDVVNALTDWFADLGLPTELGDADDEGGEAQEGAIVGPHAPSQAAGRNLVTESEMAMEYDLPAAGRLFVALTDLAREYPTDDGTDPGVRVAIGEWTVNLQPGQAQWIADLIIAELETCREAHDGGTGQCGHCDGTGRAGRSTWDSTRDGSDSGSPSAEA